MKHNKIVIELRLKGLIKPLIDETNQYLYNEIEKDLEQGRQDTLRKQFNSTQKLSKVILTH